MRIILSARRRRFNEKYTTPKSSITPAQRVEKHFVKGKPDECWPWQGLSAPERGRIGMRLNGRVWTALPSHIVYELYVGDIPKGKCVLHHCDNPPCVNPRHLYLGDRKDNCDDMMNRGRQRSPFNGDMPATFLTDEQKKEIAESDLPRSVLAETYGVSMMTVGRIKRRMHRNDSEM